jgi:hypothetical protein
MSRYVTTSKYQTMMIECLASGGRRGGSGVLSETTAATYYSCIHSINAKILSSRAIAL